MTALIIMAVFVRIDKAERILTDKEKSKMELLQGSFGELSSQTTSKISDL